MNDCCEHENTNLLAVISLIRQAVGDQGQAMLSDLPDVIATKLNLLAGKIEYLQQQNNLLRAEARRFYHSAGTFDYLDTAEEVKERHIADADDAKRWRALVGCKRVRVLGTAGVLPQHRKPDGYAHIGLELWTRHSDDSERGAVETLTAFADIARSI